MTDKASQPDSLPASPYAGRWVALLRGKVVAQGNTPEEARRAAQTHRHKESPEIVFMPSFSFSPLLASIHAALPADRSDDLIAGLCLHVRRYGILEIENQRVGREVASLVQSSGVGAGHVQDTSSGAMLRAHRDTSQNW